MKTGVQPHAPSRPGKRFPLAGWLPGVLFLCLVFAAAVRADTVLNPANPIDFFTNVASRFLRSELNLDLTRIQIYPTNQYTPAVHRLLQVAANLYEATTNRFNDDYPHLPTVFRPFFTKDGTNVYIGGYVEETNTDFLSHTLRDLVSPTVAEALQPDDLVLGVPLVIGAKKGLPNFNAVAMESVFQITRKMQYSRPSLNWPPDYSQWQTNIMYVLGISNTVGVASWNSYRSNYTRPVDIYVTDYLTMLLTNDDGYTYAPTMPPLSATLSIPNGTNTSWPLCNFFNHPERSFQIPLATYVVFLPDSAYTQSPPGFIPITNYNGFICVGFRFPQPQWGLAITNRLQFYMVDHDSQQVFDYVQLNGLNSYQNLSEEIRTPNSAYGIAGLWNTNLDASGIPFGIVYQREISLGDVQTSLGDWANAMLNPPASANSKNMAIANFIAFFTPNHTAGYQGIFATNFNLVTQVPFTPTCKICQQLTWQANDPLVHYLAADLVNVASGNVTLQLKPPTNAPPALTNIVGTVSLRYQPWGYPLWSPGPNAYNLALIDPLVDSSDDWNFPDSQPLSLAMFGNVHRGTPWQTIFLKATNILAAANGLNLWTNWTGNANAADAILSAPTNDWRLASLLVSLLNPNDPHQLLSVNDPNTNSWLGVLGGLTVLTNPSSRGPLTALVMYSDSPQAALIADAISRARASQPGQHYRDLGDILATPELNAASPWLNQGNTNVITDAAYEIIPSQLLPLLRPDPVGSIAQADTAWQVQFSGFDGYAYAVEVSTNLQDWTAISTNYPSSGAFNFPDTFMPGFRPPFLSLGASAVTF